MENTQFVLITIGLVITVLVLGAVVLLVLAQQDGNHRRSVSGPPRLVEQRQAAMDLLPPELLDNSVITLQPPQSWQPGMTGMLLPELVHQEVANSVQQSSGPELLGRLLQEVSSLRQNGYTVTLRRHSSHEEYCIQVYAACGNDPATIYLVCMPDYPVLPPQLMVTATTFDQHGEVAERQLNVQSPVLRSWTANHNLTTVVHNILGLLSQASFVGTVQVSAGIGERYIEIIS